MKKALSALFFFAISYSYGQNVTTADTIIAKKGFKLASKKVVAISNDTAIASNDSTKLITEYAAKTFAKRYAGSSSYTPSLQQVTLIDSITTKSIWIKNGNYPNGGLKIGKQVGDTTQPNIILQNTLSNGDDNAYLMFGRAGYTKQFVFQDLSQTDLFYLNNFANEHSFVVPSISSHLQDIGLFADIANNKSYLQLSGYDYLGKIKSDSISVSDKDYFLPNQSGTLALRSDVAAVSDALESYVPYTGAMFDVDLDDNNLSAKGVSIMGTGGNGHIHLKHQSSDASGTGNSTTLFANSSGYLKWKNDGGYFSTLKMEQTADRTYTFQNKSYTLADSTTLSDSVVALRTSIDAKKMIDSISKAYTSTITFAGTAPSGTTNHSYEWSQNGRVVTFRISTFFTVAGSGNTSVSFAVPSDMPTPALVTGYQVSSDDKMYILSCNGGNTRTIANPLSCWVAYNGGTPIFKVYAASQNLQYLSITGLYFTNN